jgi:hypothetical protein
VVAASIPPARLADRSHKRYRSNRIYKSNKIYKSNNGNNVKGLLPSVWSVETRGDGCRGSGSDESLTPALP